MFDSRHPTSAVETWHRTRLQNASSATLNSTHSLAEYFRRISFSFSHAQENERNFSGSQK